MARHHDVNMQWVRARDWLYSTGRLARRNDGSCDELLDFAMKLNNGVILCEVANFLQPNAIKQYHARPAIKFDCMQNIDSFRMACINHFGMQAFELFESQELLYYEHFEKVIEVLARLSHTTQAKSRGLRPFSFHDENQDLYSTLERDANKNDIQDAIYNRIDDLNSFYYSEYSLNDTGYPNESIYEDIVKIKEFRMDTPHDKKGYLIDEIFETEKNYVQLLETIISHFYDKLSPSVKMQDIRTIFHNIKDLKKIHEKLLQRLKLSLDKNAGNKIGECFLKTKESFYEYGPYCANLDLSSKRLDELCTDSKKAQLIARCLQESQQRFSLKDLLRVPTQRILKYHLLLENLLKADQFADSSLNEATKLMKSIALYINEYKRNYEAYLTIKSIQDRIQNNDADYGDIFSFGKLCKDGDIQLKDLSHNSKHTKRYAFLFEQCLLICKMRDSSGLEVQVTLDLESYEIVEKFCPSGGAKFSFGWKMSPRNPKYLQSSYQIMVKTADQFGSWMRQLEEGYQLCTPPSFRFSPHELYLYSAASNEKCTVCDEVLYGVFCQGLACKLCKTVCHRACKHRLSDCHKTRLSGPIRSFSHHKELPPTPPTNIQNNDPLQTDGASPPPIPPRAPSVKGRRSIPSLGSSQLSPSSSRSFSLDNGSPSSSPQLIIQGDLYVCTKDFNGNYITEAFEPTIKLNRGEFVEVVKRDHPMYWKGKSQSSGQVGYFPSEYVKVYHGHSRPDYQTTCLPIFHGSPQQQLYEYPWFVGEMDRAGGRMMLEAANVPDGCYLVRESQNRVGQYSIDVKFNFLVKHLKVVHNVETNRYYLTPSKMFPTIVDLVNHYQRNSLANVFRELQTRLVVPYRCLPGS